MSRPSKNEQFRSSELASDDLNVIDPENISAARIDMLADEELKKLSEMFMVIADPTRLRILAALSGRSMYVSDIVHVVGRSQSAVSHQLRVFRQAGLVKSEREGRRIRYSLEDAHIESLFKTAREHVNHRSDATHRVKSGEDFENESQS